MPLLPHHHPAAAAASLLSPAPPLCVVGWPSIASSHHHCRLAVTPHCRHHCWCGLRHIALLSSLSWPSLGSAPAAATASLPPLLAWPSPHCCTVIIAGPPLCVVGWPSIAPPHHHHG